MMYPTNKTDNNLGHVSKKFTSVKSSTDKKLESMPIQTLEITSISEKLVRKELFRLIGFINRLKENRPDFFILPAFG